MVLSSVSTTTIFPHYTRTTNTASGLADYVQQPTSAFLMARVAAEHGIHGSFLRSLMDPVPYSQNSTMLTPAFTPMQALQRGSGEATRNNVGNLGAFIPSSCAPVPKAPCGGDVTIGMINAKLSGSSMGSGMGSSSSSMAGGSSASSTQSGSSSPSGSMMGGGSGVTGSSTNSSSPQQYTGAASKSDISTALLGAAGAVAALLA